MHFLEEVPLPVYFPSHLSSQIWVTLPPLKQCLEKGLGCQEWLYPWGAPPNLSLLPQDKHRALQGKEGGLGYQVGSHECLPPPHQHL